MAAGDDTYSKILDRLDAANARLDKAERQQQVREDAAERMERQERAERRRRRIALDMQNGYFQTVQQAFDSALSENFGVRAPQPRADETGPAYLRRMCRLGQGYVAVDSEVARIDFDELPRAVVAKYGDMLLRDIKRAGTDPSTVAKGTLREIRTHDAFSNRDIVSFVGQRPFTDDFALPHRRIIGGSRGLQEHASQLRLMGARERVN